MRDRKLGIITWNSLWLGMLWDVLAESMSRETFETVSNVRERLYRLTEPGGGEQKLVTYSTWCIWNLLNAAQESDQGYFPTNMPEFSQLLDVNNKDYLKDVFEQMKRLELVNTPMPVPSGIVNKLCNKKNIILADTVAYLAAGGIVQADENLAQSLFIGNHDQDFSVLKKLGHDKFSFLVRMMKQSDLMNIDFVKICRILDQDPHAVLLRLPPDSFGYKETYAKVEAYIMESGIERQCETPARKRL